MISDHKRRADASPANPKAAAAAADGERRKGGVAESLALQLTTGCKTKEEEKKGKEEKIKGTGTEVALCMGRWEGGKALGEGFPPLQRNAKAESIKGGTSQEFPRVFFVFFSCNQKTSTPVHGGRGGGEAAKQQPRATPGRACMPACTHACLPACNPQPFCSAKRAAQRRPRNAILTCQDRLARVRQLGFAGRGCGGQAAGSGEGADEARGRWGGRHRGARRQRLVPTKRPAARI